MVWREFHLPLARLQAAQLQAAESLEAQSQKAQSQEAQSLLVRSLWRELLEVQLFFRLFVLLVPQAHPFSVAVVRRSNC